MILEADCVVLHIHQEDLSEIGLAQEIKKVRPSYFLLYAPITLDMLRQNKDVIDAVMSLVFDGAKVVSEFNLVH
jgi:hypothetical protein